MSEFLSEEFLLNTQTARTLYHEYAQSMPIIDFHCHISPREIAEDRVFQNLTQVWLEGDHYKWRLLRSDGVEERLITGNAPDRDKFQAFARVMPRLIGNPMHTWSHLELKRYIGTDIPLSEDTAQEIWEKGEARLRRLSVRELIRTSNVEIICTTDDPLDDLHWHEKIASDSTFHTKVLPAWRPDRILGIEKPGFVEYIRKLADAADTPISDFGDLMTAIRRRMDFFTSHGCVNSDHGLDALPAPSSVSPEKTFLDALSGKAITNEAADGFRTSLLCELAREYTLRGWVMQIHFGAVRNNHPKMFRAVGPDTGFDAIRGTADCGERLSSLLKRFAECDSMPKMILYSLNPADNAQIDAMMGCFQEAPYRGKLQHGSAWWFSDTKAGMQDQLRSLASLSVLGNFVGMVTDSRSFLSYTRHEYFRRILCGLMGDWCENGEYPCDPTILGPIVQDICYHNAKTFFGF